MGQQGTWRQAFGSIALSALVLLSFRWLVFEPYVIPSGSMLPTLKVLDFIYVNKFAYGVRLPFTSKWILDRDLPKRCDIVVFRSQQEDGIYLVKRVIGLPGERVELLQSGQIRIDDKLLVTKAHQSIGRDDGKAVRRELCGFEPEAREHLIQIYESDFAEKNDQDVAQKNETADAEVDPIVYAIEVPPDQVVVFGDNRHESADSRVWGPVPRKDLMGRAGGIWLSCESSLPGLSRVCDPSKLRLERMFQNFDAVDARL